MFSKYRCIECGHKADELYKNFNGGSAIKICHCERCGEVVDKYIEYDTVLIFLDAVLHKTQAYRHLLFNYTTTLWKTAVMLLLCDAYMKWDNLDITQKRHDAHQDQQFFYAALEWDIYTVFIIALLEWSVCGVTTVCLVLLHDRLTSDTRPQSPSQQSPSQQSPSQQSPSQQSPSQQSPSQHSSHYVTYSLLVHRALVLSSFGKLLAIPAVIWGQTHSSIYLLLARAFVLTSNISAMQTVRKADCTQCSTVMILVAAHTAQYLVGLSITESLYAT